MQQVVFTLVQHPILRSSENGKQFQLSLPSHTPSRSQDMNHAAKEDDELVNLDEVITLPKYDLNNLTLEQIQELKTLLSHKAKQEQQIREKKRRQVLHTIKDIFIDAFGIIDVNNQHTILDQLVYVVYRIQIHDIETNEKLLQWSKRRMEHKVLYKVSQELIQRQVKICTSIA